MARGGVMILPVGIINETHEPPTFYGVERNPVEKNIIPATWWEAGGSLSGQIGSRGLSYDVMISGGLEVDPAKVSIRSGRQKMAKSIANNLAYTGRLKYTGIPGLELAGTLQIQDDISQQSNDGLDGATLLSVHAIWNQGPLGVRVLYAGWDIDGTAAAAANKDSQDGFYAEGSCRITPKLGVFARVNGWSIQSGIDKEQTDIGVNYWPNENVVFKADFQSQNDAAGNGDGFNLKRGNPQPLLRSGRIKSSRAGLTPLALSKAQPCMSSSIHWQSKPWKSALTEREWQYVFLKQKISRSMHEHH